MRRLAVILILFLAAFQQVLSQIVISGSVRYASSREAVELANVVVEDQQEGIVVGYATTSQDGRFSITCKPTSNTLSIIITGFNISRTTKSIKAQTQELDMEVDYQEMRLQNAVIKTKPIKRTGDTLTYYVSMFSDSLDRSIGDVLKKMPGVSVNKAGGVQYHGKPIVSFYIEGMDMMGTRYGVATNNIQAKDIASVEIYENHQPVKMLKDLNLSDNAAINIKLKEKSKGVVIANIVAGVGYKPLMWEGAATVMLFTPSYQMLSTVKSNNSGRDVISELKEQYDNTALLTPYINVYSPATPDIDLERYMDNTTHSASINNLFKLSKDDILSVNAIYFYDRETFKDSSLTVYYMPSSDPLKISEATSVLGKTNETEVRVKYTGNSSKRYIEDILSFNAQWNENTGAVLTQNKSVNQRFEMNPNLNLKNKFNIAKALKGGTTLGFKSIIAAGSLPSSLTVIPSIYPSIFGYGSASDSTALQIMDSKAFHTTNSITSLSTITAGLSMNTELGFSADYQKMESSLGSEKNDMGYNRWDIIGAVGFNYRYRILKAFARLDMDYSFIDVEDKIQSSSDKKNKLFFKPLVIIDMALTPALKMNVNASYSEDFGRITDKYSGNIMTDYRSISSREGAVGENKMQNYGIGMKYADALSATFAAVNASYWWNKSNIMYGTTFIDIISRIDSYNIDNISQGYRINGKVSKFFDGISTTLELSGGYNQYWMDVLRQGDILKTETKSANAGFKWITTWFKKVKTQYDLQYTYSRTEYLNSSTVPSPIHSLHQSLSIDYSIVKSLLLNIFCEHYFNSAIVSGSRHIPFLDASLTYKTKNVEYMLEARNILGTRTYNNKYTSDATDFEYCYLLRQTGVMFKIKFSIR